MKILTIETREPTLRSGAIGWSYEDTTYIDPDVKKPIGLSPVPPKGSAHFFMFPTVIHALKHEYDLLGPPTINVIQDGDPSEMGGPTITYTWWLTKNKDVR